MFANRYIAQNKIFPNFILGKAQDNLEIAIVIPAFNETEILATLESLKKCKKPDCSVEIIIVINYPEGSDAQTIETSEQCFSDVNNWILENNTSKISFHVSNPISLPKKDAGVGFARKIGMDEALSRFNSINKADGIIACFDADSLCQENYLTELHNYFQKNKKIEACSIYFEHPTDGEKFTTEIYKRIQEYELYLRYFINAQRYANLPFAFHTIGSSMAVRAKTYCAQGGMNRRQAGEDFYFLQKIIPHGKFGELNSCTIYPSPRPSVRVPFGTGATITKLLKNNEKEYLVYNFQAFTDLKQLSNMVQNFYKIEKPENLLERLPEILQLFLKQNDFQKTLLEINSNSAGVESFTKRFFLWFNAFRTLKYLNFAHEKHYKHKELCSQVEILLEKQKIPINEPDTYNLLKTLRITDKNSEKK